MTADFRFLWYIYFHIRLHNVKTLNIISQYQDLISSQILWDVGTHNVMMKCADVIKSTTICPTWFQFCYINNLFQFCCIHTHSIFLCDNYRCTNSCTNVPNISKTDWQSTDELRISFAIVWAKNGHHDWFILWFTFTAMTFIILVLCSWTQY